MAFITLGTQQIQASEDFETNLTTTYQVNSGGVTRVKHDFIITNKTPTTFIKKYTLTTGYPGITDVAVHIGGQTIKPTLETDDSQTSIAFEFPDELVGEGKKRQFSISYTNKDLATIAGKTLEVHIPKLGDPHSYDSHLVVLETPSEFGDPVRVSPGPSQTTSSGSYKKLSFNNMAELPISAYFGSEQIYNLTLRYNLPNPSNTKALAQVALPPETTFQEIFYQDINPTPESIELDSDGNWIATFLLGGGSDQAVFVSAIVKTTLDKNDRVPVVKPTEKHLTKTTFWSLDSLSSTLREEISPLNTARQIYDFVVKKLTYSTEAIEANTVPTRLGAVGALQNPDKAVCQEFSDVFIAMSRAKNIPARRLTGYAYSQNDQLRPVSLLTDTLHAWPEYFDDSRGIWVPVDPTWENTTGGIDYFSQFDLNHIVFAINGTSSETPYPAGSYKLEGQETQDIDIDFIDNFPDIESNLKASVEPSKVFGINLPGFYQLSITNPSGVAWYNVLVSATVDNPKVKLRPVEVGTILPFTTKKVAFILNTSGLQISNKNSVTLNLNSSNNDQNLLQTQLPDLTAGPVVLELVTEPTLIVALAVFSALGLLIAGSVLVFRRKKSRSLRRKSQKPKK